MGEEEELPAIGASPVPADSRERVPTPRVSTTRIGMQEHGHRMKWARSCLQTSAPAEPGYLGDKPNLGLEPWSSGRIKATAQHGVSRRLV